MGSPKVIRCNTGSAIRPKNSCLVASWGFRKVSYYMKPQISLGCSDKFLYFGFKCKPWISSFIVGMIRGVPSGHILVAGTDVIWRQIGVKSWCLRLVLKPHWFQFNIDTSDSSWNHIGFKSVWGELLSFNSSPWYWNQRGFKVIPRRQLQWNHCGFKMNPRRQLFPAIWRLKNGLMALPVLFLRTWGMIASSALVIECVAAQNDEVFFPGFLSCAGIMQVTSTSFYTLTS